MALHELTERERLVLEAVIQMYVETAEPAGSRALSRRSGLGVSPATIRNTMSDLEEKGFLFHPHTSAGRVPTDKAYRTYVDSLLRQPPALASNEYERLSEEISAGSSAVEAILRRAAQSLGVLTQELGIALGPQMDRTVLQRLDLVRLSSERILVVLTLKGGAVRTIFVEAHGELADRAVAQVATLLNERLGGLTLHEIRRSLAERLRDGADRPHEVGDLLNIFVEEGEQLFDAALGPDGGVVLGQASVLAEQPEFASGEQLRQLMQLTETHQQLGELLRRRAAGEGRLGPGISITIGNEHADPRLDRFTLVTSEYHAGPCTGVIGVIGPTRMPYEKVIAMVSHTSRLLTELLD
ncbi:MAG TPA: heat-inducible transcriptional repressor HrcA [Gemmatimonadaceae bacterium]|nr:heat-inducible transcriptional repressor HrcA [Gemmatimonadaceae bacterium]